MAKKIKIKNKSLENRIIETKPQKDNNGRYIPYCSFGFHMGIPTQPYECETRKCTHYRRLYI